MSSTPDDELKQALLSETSKIAWKELQIFFAQGKAIHVSSRLDLIDVAMKISDDDAATIKRWMDEGLVAPVSDQQAKLWISHDILVWAVVVKPWVLVQNLKDAINPV